jgi:hypothetical protein
MKWSLIISLMLLSSFSFAKESVRKPSSIEVVVDIKAYKILTKLSQVINEVNGGSTNGHITDAGQITCSFAREERFCSITKIGSGTEGIEVSFSKNPTDLMAIVSAINDVNGGPTSGHVTANAQIACINSRSEKFCMVSKLK